MVAFLTQLFALSLSLSLSHTGIIYMMGGVTPLVYNFIFKRYVGQPGIATESARFYTVFSLFFSTIAACAIIGAYVACSTLSCLVRMDNISSENAHSDLAFFLYYAKACAIPTSFAFGLVFLTSPGASRCSSKWHSLPFVARFILAPMPWISPYLMQRLHIASGTILFSLGLYHGLAWCIMLATPGFLHNLSAAFYVAIVTGCLMLVLTVKLLWPPGMELYGRNSFKWLNTWLKDSKYGMTHVFLANGVFLLYCLHASVNLYTVGNFYIFYWTFPVLGFIILIFLHPGKLNHMAATLFRDFQLQLKTVDSYDRNFVILNKQTTSAIKRGKLFNVTLDLQIPTYDSQFVDVMRDQFYYGCCDVVLVKIVPRVPLPKPAEGTTGIAGASGGEGKEHKQKDEKGKSSRKSSTRWLPMHFETVHYYSVVGGCCFATVTTQAALSVAVVVYPAYHYLLFLSP